MGAIKRMRFKHLYLLVLVGLVAAAPAFAGTLRLGQPVVQGDNVTFPVILDGEGVSTTNFHLRYDPNVFEPVAPQTGAAAADAAKDVNAHMPIEGQYNVIIFGLNRNTMASGEVAQIVMRRKPGADEAGTEVSITDVAMADPDATAIPSRGDTYRFGGENPQADPETDAPAPVENPQVTPEPVETPGPAEDAGGAPAGQGAASPPARPAPLAAPGMRPAARAAGGPAASGASGDSPATAALPPGAGPQPAPGQSGAFSAADAASGSDLPRPTVGTVNAPSEGAPASDATPETGMTAAGERTAVATLASPGAATSSAAEAARETAGAAADAVDGAATTPASGMSWSRILAVLAVVVIILIAIAVARRRIFA
jgi:hypothetical protein